MFLQTVIKGVGGINLTDAQETLHGGGLQCNWWRRVHRISPNEINDRLSASNLDLHVNAYGAQHPELPGSVRDETPFLSLTAGAVERSTFYKTNFLHPAHRTALWFASDFGRLRGECYLFYCWVIVALRPSVEVWSLAEEIRELNSYRRYSQFQTEGEITAKVNVPSRQIHRFERYRVNHSARGLEYVDEELNPDFVDPQSVVNIREAF